MYKITFFSIKACMCQLYVAKVIRGHHNKVNDTNKRIEGSGMVLATLSEETAWLCDVGA